MRILILTQVYWPDTASTAQHLTDLTEDLTSTGHEVQVITSRFAYEDTSTIYDSNAIYSGVKIIRLRNSGFGKRFVIGRLCDFLTFNFLLAIKLFFINKRSFDVILGMTSPPLVSYIGVLFAKLKKIKFYYWAMDLQPELAIASGMIQENSIFAKLLTRIGNFIINNSDKIIALDFFMKEHLTKRGASPSKIDVIPVWPVMSNIYTDEKLNNPFRQEHHFGEKIVVMYSGNHAYVHPLDTLLYTALDLNKDNRFLFVFIGGGVRKKEVTYFKEKYNLNNIVQLDYQPRNKIHLSLGAADIQVVIMGKNQVGFTHPNKIYGAMFIGKPILYIGPSKSHISDILEECLNNISVEHGDVKLLVTKLRAFAQLPEEQKTIIGQQNLKYASMKFDPIILRKQMVESIISLKDNY